MTVALPLSPMPSEAHPRYIEYGARLAAPFGGVTQNVSRLGDRWSMSVTMPPMNEVNARAWIAAQIRAKTTGEPVRMPVPQIGGPSGVVFSGAVNSPDGTFTGSNVFSVTTGMFFSTVGPSGDSFLHLVTNLYGGGSCSVGPRLRDNLNGPANFAVPVIEGYLESNFEWTVGIAQIIGLSFVVTERK